MQILVDADACPVKQIIVRLAKQRNIPDKCADADINNPPILAEISPGPYNVIDGNHRLCKAHSEGVETLSAYMLSPKQHSLFITAQKAYDAYIEYWNGKLLYD